MPYEIAAGPLRAEQTDGELRIGWDEPDWSAPPGRRARGWSRSAPARDEPVLVLRLEALEPPRFRDRRVRVAGGRVALRPARRPTAARPTVCVRSGTSTPSSPCRCSATPQCLGGGCSRSGPPSCCRSVSSRPTVARCCSRHCSRFTSRSSSVPDGKEDGGHGLRAGWHGDIDEVDAGFATELAIIAGDGVRDCFARWARLLRSASGSARLRHATPMCSAPACRTGPTTAAPTGTAPNPGSTPASTVVAAVDDLEARGVPEQDDESSKL